MYTPYQRQSQTVVCQLLGKRKEPEPYVISPDDCNGHYANQLEAQLQRAAKHKISHATKYDRGWENSCANDEMNG